MPHGACYAWRESILWPTVVGDVLATVSYLLFAAIFLYVVQRRRDMPLRWVIPFVALFFVLCGGGHAWDVVNVWHGYYQPAAPWKLANGVVSLSVAALVWLRFVPAIMTLPTQKELTAAASRAAVAEVRAMALQREREDIMRLRAEMLALRRELRDDDNDGGE